MIALIDCNSCYASCEQVFRPDLRDKPVIVLSNNDGCIIARSKQAKQLGIPDLQPYFKIKNLIQRHNVHVFSANFRLYGDITDQVMLTLKEFSPRVERYSIDEMFLDFSDFKIDLNHYGEQIKDQVWRDTRMPVGVGIAPNKTLAKLASHAAKKLKHNQVAVLDTEHKWQWLEKRLEINKIWGIGRKLAYRLNQQGIHNAYQLAQANPKQIRRHTSVNVERTIRELNGEVCIALEENPPVKQEICVTRSFGKKTSSEEELLRHISRYAATATEKLRTQNCFSTRFSIFARSSQFKSNYYSEHQSFQLPYPTNDSSIIIAHAKRAMQSIYKTSVLFAQCGICLHEIKDRNFYQQDLFNPEQNNQSDQLMTTLDHINQLFGRDSITFGAEGLTGKWTMNQHMLSPSYTSQWHHLPIIRA